MWSTRPTHKTRAHAGTSGSSPGHARKRPLRRTAPAACAPSRSTPGRPRCPQSRQAVSPEARKTPHRTQHPADRFRHGIACFPPGGRVFHQHRPVLRKQNAVDIAVESVVRVNVYREEPAGIAEIKRSGPDLPDAAGNGHAPYVFRALKTALADRLQPFRQAHSLPAQDR